MEREDDIIDLGGATDETKGAAGNFTDGILSQLVPGISDE